MAKQRRRAVVSTDRYASREYGNNCTELLFLASNDAEYNKMTTRSYRFVRKIFLHLHKTYRTAYVGYIGDCLSTMRNDSSLLRDRQAFRLDRDGFFVLFRIRS